MVWYLLAIPLSVSPRLTVYVANVGPGLGVGRENVGAAEGPAGVDPVLDGPTAEVVGDGERSMPDPRTYTPTSPSTTAATRAATTGESSSERCRGRRRGGGS